ncbi:DeoR/GlpR family transcriptional regulator of sugar metabolism [Nocardioides luteus]|uniref:DeoR family transcriptional regulator n=1 Tax=Nocardioides luteus TaxID=1844 RepID=A0ABQ5T232_9ACTN|nr:DeoR/GlpR family DNA-binding transcription regulator [Nocardioides luteus]MDR7310273.1 DeoR/GlpR family transcriptional regulator of sugar metabolism [Nocardioides luteus]GGR53775.1 DeoR family transcriptional regulator [Nocardioides luteus]GLJ69948.1 DeoR family transcriptional regulator [Nocardioides luteus]
MLAAERQGKILEAVQRHGAARVADLATLLDVSDMTIRRDLDALAAAGRIDKVHGGATVKRRPSTDEPGFEANGGRRVEEKRAIAERALELITPGSAIGLSAGTTTWTLARALPASLDLTVVTNSMHIAEELGKRTTNVILTGGVRTPSDALVGPIAVASLQSLHLDLVFLGVHGMDVQAGFTTPNLLEAETNRAFVSAGRRLVVLADHTKWSTVGLSSIAPLHEADVIVTDSGIPADGRSMLAEAAGELVVAEV